MRSIFFIAWQYLNTTYRSRSVLIFALLMPLVFTFVLGNVLDDGSDEAHIWRIGFVDLDASPLAEQLAERLQGAGEFQVVRLEAAQAETQLSQDQLVAVLFVPQNFGQLVQFRRPVTLRLLLSPGQVRVGQLVEMRVQESLSELDGVLRAAHIAVQVGEHLEAFDSADETARQAYLDASLREAGVEWQRRPVRVFRQPVTSLVGEQVIPEGFEQSSPGMLVTFGLVLVLTSATVLIVERERGTLRRLLVMPIPKFSILVGKLAGIWIAGMVQSAVLILAGVYLFGVSWGQAPLALALMVVAFGFSVTGLGMLVAGLARTYNQANALANILMYSVAAFGGAWWPIEVTPQWMQHAAQITPTYWAMRGFQDIVVRGLGPATILPEAAALIILGFIFLFVGVWRFRYE